METVELKPHYPGLARWFAHGFATHSFESGAKGPVSSFMEIIRYMAATEPDELEKLIQDFKEPVVERDASSDQG